MKKRKYHNYVDLISSFYPPSLNDQGKGDKITRNITFQVTDDCPMSCVYCYQSHKGHRKMSFETAKKAVDILFDMYEKDDGDFINKNTKAIILDFIGGEPLMAIDVIDYICTYFVEKCIELDHPWLYTWRASMTSNGALYFDPKVQEFLKKFRGFVSFSVTIDGPKEIHDACRVYHDGRGNFDDAYRAKKHFDENFYEDLGTKVTIAPENLNDLSKIIDFFINEGMEFIPANTVFEAEWTYDHAKMFYEELKKMANRLLELNKDVEITLFDENFFAPMSPEDNGNWCWGAGTPILTTDGYKRIEDIKIGDKVYTEDGSIHPVINTMSHFANNVVKISASGIFDLICTDNHKLFCKPFHYMGFKGKKHYYDYGEYQVKDLKNKDLVRLFKLPEGNVSYDKDLAYLVGRYIGDGNDARNGKDHIISCSHEEAKELAVHFDKAGISYGTTNAKTVVQYRIHHKEDNNKNIELHRILSQCGHLATGKRIPQECFNWDKDSIQELINGYIDADGYINKKEQYRCNTVSWQLAQDLIILLKSIDYLPTCYLNKRGGKSTIQDREVNIKDRYEIYFNKDSKRTRYIKEYEDKIWTSNFSYKSAEPQMVYNITVDTNHSYVAGGLVSLNCGGTGAMLAFDPEGIAYPCLRYMPSSLGDDAPPIIVGNVDDGVFSTPEWENTKSCLDCITRRSQSTDECFNCPIAKGCAWCSAWNYQLHGTPDKRCTRICPMHKARSLANVYYWNKKYAMDGLDKKFEMHLPKEEALKIIDENEYEMLLKLST